MRPDPRHCPQCGAGGLQHRVPDGDTRPRHCCGQCGHIVYQNPLVVAGAILEWRGKWLLCRRAIEPRLGMWTYPAGFMENRETVEECARRECAEEAVAAASGLRLFSVYSLPHVSQVYVTYAGTLSDGRAEAGQETSEVRLLAPAEIPWDDLAFDVIRINLELYRAHGPDSGAVHTGSVQPRGAR